jgi:hypothetical protein
MQSSQAARKKKEHVFLHTGHQGTGLLSEYALLLQESNRCMEATCRGRVMSYGSYLSNSANDLYTYYFNLGKFPFPSPQIKF